MSMLHPQLKRCFALFMILALLSSSLPFTTMAASDARDRRDGMVKSKDLAQPNLQNLFDVRGGRVLSQAQGNFRQGEVLVKFKKDRVDVSRFLGRLSLSSFEIRKGLEREDILEPQNLTLMKSKTNETTEQLIARLKNDPSVEYVEPNYIRHFESVPNDTNFSKLWGAHNTGQSVNGTTGTNDADIDAPEAWDIYTGGANPIVAILDSGLAYDHPDLINNMWDGSSGCKDDSNNPMNGGCPNHGWDFGNNDNDPIDDNGHGTHVAGSIGAQGNNNRGVTGINLAAKIMAVKFGFDIASEVNGINFAKNNGAKIINASFSGPGFSQAERDAIVSFPGLFIVAAGNDGTNNESSHNYPSDYDAPNIIAVTSTDQNDTLSTFSNFGVISVDVAAPGENIYSTYPVFSTPFSEDFQGLTPPSIGGQFTAEGASNNWGTFGTTTKVLFGDVNNIPYANNANTSVTSSPINLSGKARTILSFTVVCDTDLTLKDYLALDVSNGSSFTEIQRFNELILGSQTPVGNGFGMIYSPDISPYMSAQSRVRFRWVTDGSNQVANNYDGCYVDDITIESVDSTGENYAFYSGTSMAAPHVAGEAAMVWSYNPSLTAAQVKSIVETTGDAKASLAGKTVSGKRINLFNALNIFQPVGGFDNANVIPASQATQSNLGDGVITLKFRLKDGMAGLPMTLKNFEYSVDGGASFQAPANGDASLALSANWNNNNYVSSTDFTGTIYSFTLNTKHADLADLNNVDQNDVIIRFKTNDGAKDSAAITSEQFRVNNATPTATLTNTPASQTTIKTTDITVSGTSVVSYKYTLTSVLSDGSGGGSGSSVDDIAVANHIQLSNLADATHTLAIKGKDAQGNVQALPTSFSWLVDTTGPTGTITNASGNPTNNKTPTLNLTIADAGVGTSSAQMQFSCDNTTWTAFEPFQFTKSDFNVSSGSNGCANADGVKTVSVKFKDSLGNIGASLNTGAFTLNSSPALAQLTLTPSNPSNDKNPQFTVGGTDIIAYKFQIDNGGFSAETGILSNIQLLNLSDASHTIQVIGKNNVGTWQLENSPTVFTWVVDTTGPTLTVMNTSGSSTKIITPALTLGLSDAGVGTSSAMVRFSCDGALWTDFEAFQTTKNNFNVRSGSNGCVAADGAKTVFAQARDSLLNLGQVAQTTEFTLDTTPPDITGLTSDATPTKSKTWNWNSPDASAVFRFSIDQSATGTTTGAYGSLKTATRPAGDGTFYIHVQSKDALGNESAVTTVSALLDNTPPTATLTNSPNNPTKFTSINVTVAGEGVINYKTKIDAGNFGSETPVATPVAAANLLSGEHTLEVIGRDIAGNYQAEGSSTRVTWTVDTTLVTVVLNGTPANPTNATTADITVSGANVDFYKFKLDQGGFSTEAAVNGHIALSNLTEGAHTITVLGRSTVGSYPTEAEGTVFTWTIDLTPPVAILTGAPTDSVTATSATITVSGTDVTHYRFMIDTGFFGAEASITVPISLTSLGLGSHTLKVIARDAVGNYQIEANASQATWTVISSGGGGGGPGGGPPPPPPTLTVPNPGRILGAKTQLFPDGTIIKLRGKKQYFYIKNGERKLLSLAEFKKKYSKGKVLELDKKTLEEIPMMKKAKASPKPVTKAETTPASPPVKNEPSQKISVEVSFPSVRIRDGIGYNAKILESVAKGQRFEVIEEKDGWYKIVWKNNGSAWIEGKWVKKIAEKIDLHIEQKFIEVLYNSVRIRDGVGYGAAILSRAMRHDRFEVLAEQNGWFKIKMPTGESAWIEGKWVKKIN